jgi:hypothetical protein
MEPSRDRFEHRNDSCLQPGTPAFLQPGHELHGAIGAARLMRGSRAAQASVNPPP